VLAFLTLTQVAEVDGDPPRVVVEIGQIESISEIVIGPDRPHAPSHVGSGCAVFLKSGNHDLVRESLDTIFGMLQAVIDQCD